MISIINSLSKTLDNSSLFRILIFKRAVGDIYLNLNKKTIETNSAYLIPPYHFCRVESSEQFWCLTFAPNEIALKYRIFLYSAIFSRNIVTGEAIAKNIITPDYSLSPDNLNSYVSQLVFKLCISSEATLSAKELNSIYHSMEYIDAFFEFANRMTMKYSRATLKVFCDKCGVCERTLNRASIMILGVSLREIVRHQMLADAISQLASSYLSIQNIADNLEFSDVTNFCRFIKQSTGITPTSLRNRFLKSAS